MLLSFEVSWKSTKLVGNHSQCSRNLLELNGNTSEYAEIFRNFLNQNTCPNNSVRLIYEKFRDKNS